MQIKCKECCKFEIKRYQKKIGKNEKVKSLKPRESYLQRQWEMASRQGSPD